MRRITLNFSMLCILIFLSGCAALPKAPWRVPLSEPYQTKAKEYEKRGELQMALINLKIAGELEPGDSKIAGKIAGLQAVIEKESERHFQKGLAFYRSDFLEGARKELLIALRYNPSHKQAIDYLKNRLTGEGYTVYRVKEGDTLKSIARDVYKDPGKDFLISSLIDIDTQAKPVPGTVLRLPVLAPELAGAVIDVDKELLKAKDALRKKDFEKALAIIGKVREYDPENKNAADLADASYYQIGKKLSLEKKYIESLKMLNQVSPEYEGVKEAISQVNKHIRMEAEIHYRKGVKHFVNEELEEAIKEWEQTLVLNPEHQKARKDIRDARSLLEKLKKIRSHNTS